jgi:hypothetical protein
VDISGLIDGIDRVDSVLTIESTAGKARGWTRGSRQTILCERPNLEGHTVPKVVCSCLCLCFVAQACRHAVCSADPETSQCSEAPED